MDPEREERRIPTVWYAVAMALAFWVTVCGLLGLVALWHIFRWSMWFGCFLLR